MTQKPTLDVRDLRTYFFTKGGVAKAVDGITFSIAPGKVLGLVGESGSGKTVTGFSILGLVDQPGRVVGGEILYRGEDLNKVSAERMRELRGVNISMIFQDPMMTLNPVLRIDTQMIEAIRAHEKVSKEIARQRARNLDTAAFPARQCQPGRVAQMPDGEVIHQFFNALGANIG